MYFERFKKEFLACMELKKDEDCEIMVRERYKNNGRLLTGVSLTNPFVCCVPTVYLEQLYEFYNQGSKIEDMVDEYIRLFDKSKTMQVPNLDFLSDFESVKDYLLFKVINTEMNKELLKNIPHISFLNLSIVFFVNVSMEAGDNSFIMIDNNVFSEWKVDVSVAYEYANRNTKRRYQTSIESIEDVLLGMLGNQDTNEIDKLRGTIGRMHEKEHKPFMYVLSNESRIYGAVGLLDSERLQAFADEIEDDFYILPSSVHELILIPFTNSCTKEELESMVCQVNSTEVANEDILSNSIYCYNRELRCVAMV